MTPAVRLEEAIHERDQIKAIDTFLKGYAGPDGWMGPVQWQFGSYVCEVDETVRERAVELLLEQRAICLERLEELGVSL